MTAGLLNIYNGKVAKGILRNDPVQRDVLVQLDDLAEQLQGYHPAPSKPAGLKRYWPFGKKQDGHSVIKGFYLYGGVGRGKSMVMDLFFTHVDVEKKRRVHFHAFMLEVHDFLHQQRQNRKNNPQQDSDRIDADLIRFADDLAKKTWLLCFDEFHVDDVADAMILGRLFTALFDRGVIVVMTSNIEPQDLYKDGLQRDRFLPFIDLLYQKTDIVHFNGDVDYRLGRLRDLNVYFWPDDKDARQSLNDIFLTISDGAKGAPQEITIKGRQLYVPRAEKEIAWFDFSDLCEQPKSALDYLELAKRFRVILVQGIPKLNDTKRNETKRLMTLIDTLYDHHVFLAVTAETPPEKIYNGQEMAFAFDRTISRLMEMQSREYRAA